MDRANAGRPGRAMSIRTGRDAPRLPRLRRGPRRGRRRRRLHRLLHRPPAPPPAPPPGRLSPEGERAVAEVVAALAGAGARGANTPELLEAVADHGEPVTAAVVLAAAGEAGSAGWRGCGATRACGSRVLLLSPARSSGSTPRWGRPRGRAGPGSTSRRRQPQVIRTRAPPADLERCGQPGLRGSACSALPRRAASARSPPRRGSGRGVGAGWRPPRRARTAAAGC